MKPSPVLVVTFVVSLFLAPAVMAQSPDSANQSAAASAPSASAAEVPRLIKFSGTLLDAQERPMSGPVGVTFALYARQTGGAALWVETQNVKPDGNGNYTVLLGANSAAGVPAELFVSGEARWLGIQVGQQPEHERILLVSVPYALKAGDAETLGGLPASAFVTNGTPGNTGNAGGAAGPTSSSSTALPKSSAATTPKKVASTPQPTTPCSSVTSDGTATVNSIALFTAACNVQGSVMTQSSGNVGIGTATPAVAVDVVGNNAGLRLSGTGTHQVTVTGATSGRLGQDANGFFFASDTKGSNVRFLTNNGTLNEWMRVTSAGNVGVGTLTPTQKLEVNVNSTSTGDEAVRGVVVAQNTLSFNTVGVHGITNSGGGRGVVGEATSGTTTTIGVQGLSSSDAGIGVSGIASTGGSTVGVQGEATAGPVSGNTIGVRGVSASNFGTGVQGEATSSSGFGAGVHGLLFGTTGTAGLFSAGPGATLILGQSGGLNMFSVDSSGNVSLAGNLSLANTTAGGAGGVITLGGGPFLHNFGTNNTFVGASAGNFTMSGFSNSAFGSQALKANTTGTTNSAFGNFALGSLTGGNNNIAIGNIAGSKLTTGSNNIYVGNTGPAGGSESSTIRIGDATVQTATFIAGISGVTSASGVTVFINPSGQLGTVMSSRRFKHEIADMGEESDLLMKLRPVAFYYKPELDETQTRQYGLVAEEVAQVAPQLVVFDKDGAPQTVRYHFVNAMLLNEVQKQRALVEEQQQANEEQRSMIEKQQNTIARQQAEIHDLAARLAKLEALVAPAPPGR